MPKFNLIIIITLNVSFSFSQNNVNQYYENINLAEHFFLNQNYNQTDSCYSIAFNAFPKKGFNQDYLTAAINSMKMGDTTSINKYLLGFAKRGGDYTMLKNTFNQNIILEDNAKLLFAYVLLNKNKVLRKDLDKLYMEYKNTVNWQLIRKINRMYFSDQVIARGFFTNLLPLKTQAKIMNRIDNKHAKQLLKICNYYGYWVGFDLLGEYRLYGKYRLEKIDMIIRHFSQDNLKLFERYILGAIKNLQYYPYSWASCLDYAQIKKPVFNESLDAFLIFQRYGTMSSNVEGINTIMPFGKRDELSINRKLFYLSDIEDYCLIRNLKLPEKEFVIILKSKK